MPIPSRPSPASRLAALLLAACATVAHAAFPDKPIRLVVPYAAGGGTDAIARHLAQRLGPRLDNQPVLVDNRTGADGIIGTEYVAKSPPDGYTYVLVVTAHLVNPYIKKKLPFDTLEDLVGVTRVAQSPMVFAAKADAPYSNPQELAAAIRKDLKAYGSYGSSDSMTRLVGAMFNQKQHLADVTHIAYRGGAPLVADTAAGNLGFAVTTLLSAKPLIEAGRLKAIGITSGTRSPLLPSAPTMVESGMKDFEIYITYSIYAPAKTPREILERMQHEVAAVVKSPEMVEILAQQAAVPVANSVTEFNAQSRSEAKFWEKLVKDTGIVPE
ncbi:tripartite tricarboxylate transporter substrate binding protein [Xylophilus rhododendri]|uniref:Tripartite tricarboxylate transporter substrate binding protein n=1 Tax=Xylophilus rhododendri TaxID=2697032 RepID=A0A857J024_9BURK|nr:tripartite tricarboxylate transporter substrate-binding protein [Xylophilus rhododendri]QHI97214.1 tripartite tricarboxylate transporter substrate binding protein [Xylophilus rhododendri]